MIKIYQLFFLLLINIWNLPAFACSTGGGPYEKILAQDLPDYVMGDINKYMRLHIPGAGFIGPASGIDIQTKVVPEGGEQVPIRIVIDADAWILRDFYIDEIKVVAEDLEVKYVDVLNDKGQVLARLPELQKVKSTYTVAGFQLQHGHPLDEIKFRYTRLGTSSRLRVFVRFIPINTANEHTPKPITKVGVASLILRNGYCSYPVIQYEPQSKDDEGHLESL